LKYLPESSRTLFTTLSTLATAGVSFEAICPKMSYEKLRRINADDPITL
jgi:hypothetical protein